MEQNTIMNTEVVEEAVENVTEEIVSTKASKIAKSAVGLGIVTLGGYMLFKKVLKPLAAKRKAKKLAKENAENEVTVVTPVETTSEDDDFDINEEFKPID